MYNKLVKKFTNEYQDVPLLYITFDLKKFKEYGEKGSCITKIHPELGNDPIIEQRVNELIDYIRDNHDMEKLVK